MLLEVIILTTSKLRVIYHFTAYFLCAGYNIILQVNIQNSCFSSYTWSNFCNTCISITWIQLSPMIPGAQRTISTTNSTITSQMLAQPVWVAQTPAHYPEKNLLTFQNAMVSPSSNSGCELLQDNMTERNWNFFWYDYKSKQKNSTGNHKVCLPMLSVLWIMVLLPLLRQFPFFG